jgi:hypothetical protein
MAGNSNSTTDVEPSTGVELIDARTLKSKTYDLGHGRRRLDVFDYHVHYRSDDGKLHDVDTTIEDGRVWRCGYEAQLDGAGFTGKGPRGRMFGVKLCVDAVDPVIEGSVATYRDILKDTDFVITFMPNGVRAQQVLKTPDAPKSAQYELLRDAGLEVLLGGSGVDANDCKLELDVAIDDVSTSDGVTTYLYTQIWTGRVAQMDEVTRKRSWVDTATYPVIIG